MEKIPETEARYEEEIQEEQRITFGVKNDRNLRNYEEFDLPKPF